jgi:mRNA-degrading endonuclease RelE of RelBE toxin-antitoxin system
MEKVPAKNQRRRVGVRRSFKAPECGEPRQHALDGLRKYCVRHFRIVYVVDRRIRVIRLMAVGLRQHVYEELTARLRRKT